MFPRFLTRADFDRFFLSKSIRPDILKWRSLENGAIFRVIDRVVIPNDKGDKIYAILETEGRQIIHVWITSIINDELKKYDLSLGNIFIKPLGKITSPTSGYEYYNFAVVIDSVNFM